MRCLFLNFSHPDRVNTRIETVEGGRVQVELVAKNNYEVAHYFESKAFPELGFRMQVRLLAMPFPACLIAAQEVF